MYIETLFDQIEEQFDHEIVERPEYQKRDELYTSCLDKLEQVLMPDQKELLLELEAAMNHLGSYITEFYFWKGYERGIADEMERASK